MKRWLSPFPGPENPYWSGSRFLPEYQVQLRGMSLNMARGVEQRLRQADLAPSENAATPLWALWSGVHVRRDTSPWAPSRT